MSLTAPAPMSNGGSKDSKPAEKPMVLRTAALHTRPQATARLLQTAVTPSVTATGAPIPVSVSRAAVGQVAAVPTAATTSTPAPARPVSQGVQFTGIEHARWLAPQLAVQLHAVPTRHAGVPRDEVKVPISPTDEVDGSQLFEDASNPAQQYYLPRYDVPSTAMTGGGHRFSVELEVTESGGRLKVGLRARPPEGVAEGGAQPIPHDLTLVLRVPLGHNPQGVVREYVFQEIREGDGAVEGILDLDPGELGQVYSGLRDGSRAISLLARRTFKVALPVEPPAPPSSPPPAVPSRPSRPVVDRRPGSVVVRDHRKAVAAARRIRRATPGREAPSPPHFRETTRNVEAVVAPDPFVFEPNLHPYVYAGADGVRGAGGGLVRRQATHDGKWHSYYQDEFDPGLFHFLPDEFRIARRPESPHHPFLVVSVDPADDPGETGVFLTLVGACHVDAERVEAAREALRVHLPPGGGAGGPPLIRMEPLVTGSAALELRLRPPLSQQLDDGVAVDLRTGFRLDLAMTLTQFQGIYDGLFTDVPSPLDGSVTVPVGVGDTEVERVPFVADLGRLAGPLFDVTPPIQVEGGAWAARILQCIESPLRLRELVYRLHREGALVAVRGEEEWPSPAGGDGLRALLPGEEVSVRLEPLESLPGEGPVQLGVHPRGVKVELDRAAVTQAIMDPTTPADYARTVEVFTLPEWFHPPEGSEGGDQIRALVVELEGGTSLRLTEDAPAGEAQLFRSVEDLLNRQVLGPLSFRYRVTPVRIRGAAVPSEWISHEGTILYPSLEP